MKKYFVAGLVILLPVTITILIVGWAVRMLTKPFVGFVSHFISELHLVNKGFLFLSPEQLVLCVSQLLILLVLGFLTIILGILARWFLIRMFVRVGDRLLHNIPLVNKVYRTTQEVVKTIFSGDKNSFKQVVMVPFQEGGYMLGFISGNAPSECSSALHDPLVSVLIPITPNPMTGFLSMFRQSDLIFIDMKPEDAVKYILSCGVIVPSQESFPASDPEEGS